MSVLDQDYMFSEVVQRLRAAAQDDRTFDAAQMQLINLPEIIRNAGPHWPKLKDKIRASSVGFLRGCLDDADLVIPAGDGFLIIFNEGEPATLRERAEELRALLLEFYLGRDELKRLGIRVDHRQFTSRELGEMFAPPPPPSTAPVETEHQFVPVWSSQAQLIASYFCSPTYKLKDVTRFGYDKGYAKNGSSEHRDYCELDLFLLNVAEEALARYGAGEARPAIGVPVHATTMQNRKARGAYLERLGNVPPETMRHMYVKIAEIDQGAPTINLSDWVGLLRARVRTILLEFHSNEAMAPNLTEVGVWGAGYRAPVSSRETPDLLPHVRQIRRWGESLTRQRVRFFVDELRWPGLIRLAAESGAHFVSSEEHWPAHKWPAGVISAPPPTIAPFSPPRKTVSSPAS